MRKLKEQFNIVAVAEPTKEQREEAIKASQFGKCVYK